jgi:uncharacterized protein
VLLHLSGHGHFSIAFLVILGILALGISIADNVLPMLGAKKYGGSRRATRGAALGLLIGFLFLPPIGILLGPFLGAFIGELTGGKDALKAMKISLAALLGFLMGIVLKITISGFLIFYYGYELIKNLFF